MAAILLNPNPTPETRNPKPETRNPKPETPHACPESPPLCRLSLLLLLKWAAVISRSEW